MYLYIYKYIYVFIYIYICIYIYITQWAKVRLLFSVSSYSSRRYAPCIKRANTDASRNTQRIHKHRYTRTHSYRETLRTHAYNSTPNQVNINLTALLASIIACTATTLSSH